MRGALAALAAAAALLAPRAAARVTNPDHRVVVSQNSGYEAVYDWEYVSAAGKVKEHLLFDLEVTAPVNGERIHGLSLGLAVQNLAGTKNDYLFMQGSRKLLFVIDYKNGAPIVTSTRLNFEFCYAGTRECNGLSGWDRPISRMRQNMDISKNICTSNKAEVVSISSPTNDGTTQTIILKVKLFADAFQTCELPDSNPSFGLDFAPGAVSWMIFGVWVESGLADLVNRDPFYTNMHDIAWSKKNPVEMQWTVGAPTATPTASPTGKPTPAPTDKPTKSPTPEPTGLPTPAPTPYPSRVPTRSPSGRPTKAPTNKPTRAPTSPQPTRAPTAKPTPRPTDPLICPDHFDWVKCSRVNDMFKHFRNDPERRIANIRRTCNSDEYKYCMWCNAGADSNTGCRPRKSEKGIRQEDRGVCDTAGDPFFALGCQQFPECPRPEVMSACGSINSIQIEQRWRLHPLCEGGFDYKGYTIAANECVWCNGVCRALAPYNGLQKTICDTPGLFDQLRQCPTLDSVSP